MNRLFVQRKIRAACVAVAGMLLPMFARDVVAADAPAAAPATQPVFSLEPTSDEQLMAELASRGAEILLDRYFDLNHVPDARRAAVRSLSALRDLTDPGSKLSPLDRQRRARELATNVDTIIGGIDDPQKLVALSSVMIEYAVTRDVNTLEYWGQNPAVRARLRPVADAIYKLLGKASELAESQASQIATQIKSAEDTKTADLWTKLDELSRSAKYQQNMSAYFRVLSADPTSPDRRKIADDAALFLDQFDNPDMGVQARVRNMKGKLSLARGAYKEARRFFATVAADKGQIKPSPNPFEQYEARYFAGVSDLLNKDLSAAEEDLTTLDSWQKQTFPKLLEAAKLDAKTIDDTGKGVSAAAEMLRYRVDLLRGELAKSPADRKTAEGAAEAVLLQLRKDRPELAPVIDDQLLSLMPADRPVSQLGTLMLQGLMSKGTVEYKKPDAETPDIKIMERAIEASRELLARQGKDKDVTPQMAADATVLIPSLLDRTGHAAEAASGYLDYATHFQSISPAIANQALDRAGYLVFDLKKKSPAPEGFSDLYARFLKTAVEPPFNHKELAYLMGEHLQGQGKVAQALPYFQMVPKESPSFLNAQYKQMLCLRDLLEGTLPPAQHKTYVDLLMAAAGKVKELAAGSTSQFDRAKAVQSTLVFARLVRTEQHDPKASLTTLSDFDTLAKGLPGEKGLQSEALFERVQAQMDLGQFNQATDALVNLLGKTEGSEGMALVRQLLDQLDQQYQKADLTHDLATMRLVTKNEAQLTGFLGDWAKDNKDLNIRKFYYAYVVYDARTKRLAGAMSEDPAERKKLLDQTLSLYQSLQTPAMHDLFVKTLDSKKVAAGDINPKDADPSVQVGLALTQFELGDYKDAQATLGDLLVNQKLGPPSLVEATAEGVKPKVNDLYWEATYKLLKSNAELAKIANDKAAQGNTERGLKNILIRGGIPERWQDEFENLRKEIIPDFKISGSK